jgi:hypothetical protein
MAVSRPDEIVHVFSVTNQNPEDAFSYPEYLELQSQATAFNSAFNGLEQFHIYYRRHGSSDFSAPNLTCQRLTQMTFGASC